MSERIVSQATYLTVFVVLLALTVLTIGLSFVPLHGPWHIALGVTIGLCKATLVILFFMHALYSTKVTWVVIGGAIFWLAILVVLTLTDYFSRGRFPYPGH